jgi:HK97 family phage portal protein
VLPGGGEFTYHKMTINPEDAELLETRKFGVEEICRLFQVPPPIVQDYSHNTFTNSEQAGRWFAQFCLLPWVRKLEAAFNRALFAGTDLDLVLDMSGFDRGTPESRWAAHAIAVSNGVLTVDEIRELEGWGPKGD